MTVTKTPKAASLAKGGRLGLISLAFLLPLSALSALTPEQEAKRIVKYLKPIPDADWAQIAGAKLNEKYEITRGDTLYDISKRLFGDAKYWPKIWAMNNGSILNPHRILPGKAIAFTGGSGTSLPGVSIQGEGPEATASDAPPAVSVGNGHTMEWKNLPLQSWESNQAKPPAEVDALGFDTRGKITFSKPRGFELAALVASEKIPLLGQIVGSRSESNYLAVDNTVYIRADEELQLGETYAVTQAPTLLKSRASDRTGYSYMILGKVKVIGVRDNLFVGTLSGTQDYLARGASLIKLPPRVPELTPVAAPNAIEGVMMVDHSFSTYLVAQHKQVYIDRGTDDGIQTGMVFRAYEHFDPSNDKKITSSNFIIDADLLVVQVTPRFSSAIMIHCLTPVVEDSAVVLLTDVSDLTSNRGIREKLGANEDKNKELDELDKMDSGGEMGKDEEKELKQLEKWKSNPEQNPGATPPPAGEGVAPPPPPAGEPGAAPPPETSAPPPPPPDAGMVPPAEGAPPPPPPGADSTPPTAPPPVEGTLTAPPPAPPPADLSAQPPGAPAAPAPPSTSSAPPPAAAPPAPPADGGGLLPPPPGGGGGDLLPPPPP